MVYVDNYNRQFGRMKMCHMIADTPEELREMAQRIGCRPRWLQHPGTAKEHYDVPLFRKAMALSLGAQEVGYRELAAMVAKRKRPV